MRVFNAYTRRVGGIRFLRIGNWCFSFCRTTKPLPALARPFSVGGLR